MPHRWRSSNWSRSSPRPRRRPVRPRRPPARPPGRTRWRRWPATPRTKPHRPSASPPRPRPPPSRSRTSTTRPMSPMWTPKTRTRTTTSSPSPTVAAPGEDPAGGDRRLWTRVRLDIAYDGTDFSGWAAQPGRRTVAGVLAVTLIRLVGAIEAMTVAGRTDAGVHATGQVSHVDIPADRWVALADTLVHRLAGLLPP